MGLFCIWNFYCPFKWRWNNSFENYCATVKTFIGCCPSLLQPQIRSILLNSSFQCLQKWSENTLSCLILYHSKLLEVLKRLSFGGTAKAWRTTVSRPLKTHSRLFWKRHTCIRVFRNSVKMKANWICETITKTCRLENSICSARRLLTFPLIHQRITKSSLVLYCNRFFNRLDPERRISKAQVTPHWWQD